MTDKAAGEILERCYDSKVVTQDQLEQVRHSLSYSYYLKTGIGGDNWTEVKSQWRSYHLAGLPKTQRPVKPTRIPTPANLRKAFLKRWKEGCGISLAMFVVGVLSTWDFHVFGLRPNVDIKKVKDSDQHEIVSNEGYGKTKMVNGRSKLHLHKRGTRPWWVFRCCTCKVKHKSPTPYQMRLKKNGNPFCRPTWNTCCPVAAMQFLEHHQGSEWKPYAKWTKAGEYGIQNVGDVPTFANEWLNIQGQHSDDNGTPFSRNSGRKSLARWLAHLGVPYIESLHIHGDLEQVWRGAYQDSLSKSHYRVREQSSEADVATKGLRRFTKWVHNEKSADQTAKIAEIRALLDRL